MKSLKFKTLGLLFMAILLSMNTNIFAQRGNGGWKQNSNYGRMFNPQTIETITGTVVAVERIIPEAKMSYGLHLKIKTNSETISAHLGPTWYLDNQDIQFIKGDVVTITGSRITFQNAPAIIVTEAIRNEYTLRLRDKSGYPVWSGWRRRGMQKGRNRG